MKDTQPDRQLAGFARSRSGLQRVFVSIGEPDIVHHDVVTPRWPGAPLSIAALSDFHPVSPWNGIEYMRRVVEHVNAMPVDLVVLLGDYIPARPTPGWGVSVSDLAEVLAELRAPMGVFSVLGNHDWRDDDLAHETGFRDSRVLRALRGADHRILMNESVPMTHGDLPFWLVGFDSQQGHKHWRHGTSRHDPEAAFADVPEEAPVVLLAHEPDYFALHNPRATLQLSGHTHGGQANFFGWRPFTPSEYHGRYAYGHVEEDGHHLVVSGGLGYSHLPLRIAQPPEITLITLRNGPLPARKGKTGSR